MASLITSCGKRSTTEVLLMSCQPVVNYTEGSPQTVLLGLPILGKAGRRQLEQCDPLRCSRIGGLPAWHQLEPPSDKLRCGNCGGGQVLLVEIYTPLPDQNLERSILVFACIKRHCSLSGKKWCTAFRSQKSLDTGHSHPEPQSNERQFSVQNIAEWGAPTEAAWDCISQENTTSDSILDDDLLQMLQQAEKKQTQQGSVHSERSDCDVNNPPIGRQIKGGMTLKEFLLRIEFEPCESTVAADDHSIELLRNYEEREGRISSTQPVQSSDEWNEEYEESTEEQLFLERLAAVPNQVVRYSFGDEPLLPCKTNLPAEKCSACGCLLRFEFQICPAILFYLKAEEKWNCPALMDAEGTTGSVALGSLVDFHTLVVRVCGNSCCQGAPTGWAEESVTPFLCDSVGNVTEE